MHQKYVLVLWPYSQLVMEHPRFNECYLLQAFEQQQHYDCAYFVPEDIYDEVVINQNSDL